VNVDDALELHTPPFVDVEDRWREIAPQRRPTWRRALLAAGAIAVVTTVVATPALGLRGLIANLVGRIDLSFSSGRAAPVAIKRDFYDLDLGVPPSMAQDAVVSQARRVATFTVRGRRHTLWVAPTRRGGYCWEISGAFGGCRARAKERLGRLSVSYVNSDRGGVDFVASVEGDITAPSAHSLTLEYADGSRSAVPFYFVSKPIDAGFFYAAVPAGHDTAGTRLAAAVLRDSSGHLLARTKIAYETPAQSARRRAQVQATLKRLRRHHALHRYASPALPPPTAPFQTGGAGGVKVTVGHNGVVVFDLVDASPAVRNLIAGNADYDCFKRLPYHDGPVSLGFPRSFARRVTIRLQGKLSPPFLGCEIQGMYGHRWPDRKGSHSAVEIALTPAARPYFTNRATARDLALFVRSRTMHAIRKLTGPALDRSIRGHYGTRILKLSSAAATPQPGRIGYARTGSTTTFVERSPTGRTFFVRFVGGRLAGQNVEPYAYPF